MKTKFQSKQKQKREKNNKNCATGHMSNRVPFIFVSLFISTNYELEPNVSMLMFDCRQTDNTFALKLTFRFSFVASLRFLLFFFLLLIRLKWFRLINPICWPLAEVSIESKMRTRVNRRL